MGDSELLDLVDLCYQAVDTPDCWQEVTIRIADSVQADAGDISIEEYDSGVARAIGTIGFEKRYRENYDWDFLGSNPWIEALKTLPLKRSVWNHAEPDDFEQSTYYNEWVRPQGYRHAVGVIMEHNHNRLVHMGFLRNRDHGEFSPDDARALDRILPHIHRSITICEKLRIITDGPKELFALVDSLHVPAFLIDESKAVLYANEAADSLCLLRSEVSISQGKIAASNSALDRSLQSMLDDICRIEVFAEAGSRTELVVPREEGRGPPLIVELVPLRNSCVAGSRQPRCLVLVNDPDKPLPDRLELLSRTWELTPSEARLAWALANGETIVEYSARRSVSAGTVRWHLKNIQAKTETRSLEALVRLVHSVMLRV